MSSLFLKIFLWFWLTVVVIGATLVITTLVAGSRSRANDGWKTEAAFYMAAESKRAADIFEQEGTAALEKHIGTQLRKGAGPYTFFFDENGKEILGHNAPANAMTIARSVNPGSPFRAGFLNDDRFAAQQAAGPSGRKYTLVVIIPSIPIRSLLIGLGAPAVFGLASVFLLGGVLCFWLARHIAGPLEHLGGAAGRIADGRLDTRVDKTIRRRRDEIGRLGLSFDRMAERIEALVAAQQRMLGVVSHELRSPLARLGVALGLLRQSSPEEETEYMDRIELEAGHLDKLIGQLLILAKIDSGADPSHRQVFDLGNLIQEIAADGNFEAQGRSCTVKLDLLDSCMIEGVAENLRRAVENVVRNAIRYTKPHTAVEVTLRQHASATSSAALIRVRDHGPGVPIADLKNIFLPFHRVQRSEDAALDGAGLGLAITERIVHAHGGRVEASNAHDGGLVIEMELPLTD